MFITFEGIDGSGKSTQITRAAKYLRELGLDVLIAREPGGTPLGEAIRAILLDPQWKEMTARTEFFLYSASRAQLVEDVVRPHLDKPNGVVILDRYDDSSTAYQGGGRELGVEVIEAINGFATGGLVPDLTFVLDVDWASAATRRMKVRPDSDRLELNTQSFFERTRAAYRELVQRHPERMVLVDASQPEEIVFARIQEVLATRVKVAQ